MNFFWNKLIAKSKIKKIDERIAVLDNLIAFNQAKLCKMYVTLTKLHYEQETLLNERMILIENRAKLLLKIK